MTELVNGVYDIMSQHTYVKPILFVYMWAIANSIAPYIYIKLCTPDSILSFLTSPFRVLSPECKCLRWIIDYSADTITMFQLAVSTRILNYFRYTNGMAEQ